MQLQAWAPSRGDLPRLWLQGDAGETFLLDFIVRHKSSAFHSPLPSLGSDLSTCCSCYQNLSILGYQSDISQV